LSCGIRTAFLQENLQRGDMKGIIEQYEDIVIGYLISVTNPFNQITSDELKQCIRIQKPNRSSRYCLDVFFMNLKEEKKQFLQQTLFKLCPGHPILWRVSMAADWMMTIDMYEDDFQALKSDAFVAEAK